ncbi:MAG: J domain-containing protein [Methylococcales bacterium]|nr:J domain-containing protein [Methylococcales bacterium]MDD5754572.1 J domain-containing protein [Methylococcales bacterium]
MVIHNSGIALYFLMAFGSGYAIGNLPNMGFLKTWFLSIIFVPVVYELLNPNALMVMTVVGFSFGLLFAKSMSFFQLMDYLSPFRFLQKRSESKPKSNSSRNNQQHNQREMRGILQNSADNRRPEEVLGLSPNFTQSELKAAYQRESNRTHPDKWVNKPESIRKIMEAEQKQINAAYNKLRD